MAYDNETYLQSLGQARSSITRGVQNTLAEIGRQEQHGRAQSGKIPGAVDQSNQQVRDTASATTGAMQGAIDRFRLNDPATLGGAVDGAQGQVDRRLQAVRDAWGRAAPLLAQGFQEQGVQQRGMANQIGQQLYAQNDMQRADYISRRQAEDRQRAFAEEQARRQQAMAQEQLAQQARLQQERLAAEAAEAQAQRDWQEEQAQFGFMHEAFIVNPFTGELIPNPNFVPNPAATRPPARGASGRMQFR